MNIANGNIEVICCWNLLVQLRGLTCNVGILEHLPPRSISGIADSALHARTDLVVSCGVMLCHSQPIIDQFPSISNLQLEGIRFHGGKEKLNHNFRFALAKGYSASNKYAKRGQASCFLF